MSAGDQYVLSIGLLVCMSEVTLLDSITVLFVVLNDFVTTVVLHTKYFIRKQ